MSDLEAQIRDVMNAWNDALTAKDVDRLASFYAKDAVLFDVTAPDHTGRDAIRAVWQNSFKEMPADARMMYDDLHVRGSDTAAVLFGYSVLKSEREPDHMISSMRVRFTVFYEKIDGQWRSVHEHVSFPMDPATGMCKSA